MVIGIVVVSTVLLLATWVLYPVVIAVLARSRRAMNSRWSGDAPLVTIIVATRESPEAVHARVRDLLASDYPPARLRVVVGLDVSGEGNVESPYAFADSRVRVVRAEGVGKAAALNAAVALAEGEVLVFTDTAQQFDSSAVRTLVDALSEPGTSIVSGALHTGPDAGGGGGLVQLYWRMERSLRKNEGRLASTVGVTGAIYAMQRRLWSPLPAGLILDDLFVPMRVILEGGRVRFEERAVAFDRREFQTPHEYRRKVRTLTGVLQLCAWLPAVLVPWRNPAWLPFVFHKLLRFATPLLLLLLIAGVLAGFASQVARAGWTALAVSGLLAFLAIGAALVVHQGMRRMAWEGLVMQAAVVRALANAVRARWDVW